MDLTEVLGKDIIPIRDPAAVSGSEFINNNINLEGSVREQNILNEFLSGNIPSFLRRFVPLQIKNKTDIITYLVMSDVLSIGNDDDYVRMPMNPHTAQKIADLYDCSLPTTKICKDIWKYSFKLDPQPWGPPYDSDMWKTHRILTHNQKINDQIKLKRINKTKLLSGHKKDVVLTNKLYPNNPNKRVAIFGWFYPTGEYIQGLNPKDHDDLYEDYSHGIRLISNDVIVNGSYMKIQDVFKDSRLCELLSEEGKLLFSRY